MSYLSFLLFFFLWIYMWRQQYIIIYILIPNRVLGVMEGFKVSIFIGGCISPDKSSQFDWKFIAETEFRIKHREISWEQE